MNVQEIFDGALGGGRLPVDRLRTDINEPKDLVVSTDLDRRLARLLILHPELQIKFRNNDLASLDKMTKEALLEDINGILKIAHLANE